MSKVTEYLKENRIGQFATLKDGQIVMRPFHFLKEQDGLHIFATANNKEVYQQLMANPTAAFAVMGNDGKWLRMRGQVTFSDDQALKDELFEFEPLLKQVYKSSDNPVFEVFCIHDGVASLHGGMGNTIEEIEI